MARKFYDIIPPKKIEISPEKKGIKPKRIFLKSLIFCFIFLILLGIAAFYIFSKVEIEIWPVKDTLNLKEEVFIDLAASQTNFEQKIIPGKIFSDEKSALEEFPASGKMLKAEKARGTIRVYNAASSSPRVLVPSRFVSSEGKLFWSQEKIIIPGFKYEKGKLITGEKDVEVLAAKAGEDYNIGPSTFALPALAGSSSYTTIYGKSFSPMTGGLKKEVSQVSKEDLEKAENTLVEKLKKESKEFLKKSVSENFILLDETILQEIKEINSSLKAESEGESFNLEVKIQSTGFGFKKTDIENFAKNLISLNISENKKIQEESLKISYSLESLNTKPEKISLNLEIEVKIYSDIDVALLKKALLEKSSKEIKIYLENLPQVERAEIKSWPILRKKSPENIEKVEIKLNLGVD